MKRLTRSKRRKNDDNLKSSLDVSYRSTACETKELLTLSAAIAFAQVTLNSNIAVV